MFKKIDFGIKMAFLKAGFLALLAIMGLAIEANSAYLKWDAVQAPTEAPVIGYIVHYQLVDGTEVYNYDLGNVVEYQLPGALNLETGKDYRFWLTVYNKDGESAPSNAADWLIPNWEPPVNKLPDIIINVPDSSTLNISIVNDSN